MRMHINLVTKINGRVSPAVEDMVASPINVIQIYSDNFSNYGPILIILLLLRLEDKPRKSLG